MQEIPEKCSQECIFYKAATGTCDKRLQIKGRGIVTFGQRCVMNSGGPTVGQPSDGSKHLYSQREERGY